MSRAGWVPVNVQEFLRGGRVVRGFHDFTRRVLHWPYCKHCGLVMLRNVATQRQIAAPCVRLED